MCSSRYAAAFFSSRPAVLHALEINADFLERVGQADAVLVLQAARFVHVEIAGAGGGAEQAFAETRAFLVRPIHEADGHGRLAVVLRVDAAQDFDAGEDVEAAVEPAAVGHGIHVAADEQRAIGFAAQGGPEIAGGVGVDFDRQAFELFAQPGAGGDPHLGESDALRAVVIAGEGAEFLEFGDGAFGIQGVSHKLARAYSPRRDL